MSSPHELLDLALLRAYVAEIVPDDHDAGGAALQRAIELFARRGSDVGLFGGAARIGRAITTLSERGRLVLELDDNATRETFVGDFR